MSKRPVMRTWVTADSADPTNPDNQAALAAIEAAKARVKPKAAKATGGESMRKTRTTRQPTDAEIKAVPLATRQARAKAGFKAAVAADTRTESERVAETKAQMARLRRKAGHEAVTKTIALRDRFYAVEERWEEHVKETEARFNEIPDHDRFKADLVSRWRAEKSQRQAHIDSVRKAVDRACKAVGITGVLPEFTPAEEAAHAERVKAAEHNARMGHDSWAVVDRIKAEGPQSEAKADPGMDARLVRVVSDANRGMASQADVARVKAEIASEGGRASS